MLGLLFHFITDYFPRRIYRMESVEELEIFQAELLKRPLVLQPVIRNGSGLQKMNCFFSTVEGRHVNVM